MTESLFTSPVTLEQYKAQLQAIPGGSFEREGFTVTLSPFKMGRTPVTVGMWQEYAKAKRNGEMPELPDFPVWKDGWDAVRDHPMVMVSWEECKAYADWAELLLPTEAQWEYAARGGLKEQEYPWGNDWDVGKVWCGREEKVADAGGTVSVVRENRVFINGYGLIDMTGNVSQWCWDWYGEYSKRVETDPIGASSGDVRTLRGGSWFDFVEYFFRCAYRSGDDPTDGFYCWGFRLSSP